MLIDGYGDDQVTGDEGNDTLFVGPGADEIYSEEGDDIIYLFNDGVRDDIFCDDGYDQVVWVGTQDVTDNIGGSFAYKCESVTVQELAPANWPY